MELDNGSSNVGIPDNVVVFGSVAIAVLSRYWQAEESVDLCERGWISRTRGCHDPALLMCAALQFKIGNFPSVWIPGMPYMFASSLEVTDSGFMRC
jgi:hypothetical protein